jgi:hypothetical protein
VLPAGSVAVAVMNWSERKPASTVVAMAALPLPSS